MLSLTNQFKRDFDAGVRQRGADYFRMGCVTVRRADDRSVKATVSGSREYQVELDYDRNDDLLHVSCDCPYGNNYGDPCKHLYATLLAAEARGALRALRANTTLILDGESDDEDEEWDEPTDQTPSNIVYVDIGGGQRKPMIRQTPKRPVRKTWQQRLKTVGESASLARQSTGGRWPAERELNYLIDMPATLAGRGTLTVQLLTRDRKRNGEWGKPQGRSFIASEIASLPDPIDRQVLSLLAGARMAGPPEFNAGYGYTYSLGSTQHLPPPMERPIVQLLCQTGRCSLLTEPGAQPTPLTWDDGPTWEFRIKLTRDESGKTLTVGGAMWRDGVRRETQDHDLITGGGLLFADGKAAPLDLGDTFEWLVDFKRDGPLSIRASEAPEFVEALAELPKVPKIELPEELRFERRVAAPRPRLTIRRGKKDPWGYTATQLTAELGFEYEGSVIARGDPRLGLYLRETRTRIDRDLTAEAAAESFLRRLGFRDPSGYYRGERRTGEIFQLVERHLKKALDSLIADGWWVEAEGKVFRNAGAMSLRVASGVDWFELHGAVSFDGQSASLPELLRAIKKGENTVLLDDGTYGILPEQWLQRYGTMAAAGEVEGDHLRFRPTQALLLDALLDEQGQATWDEPFAILRNRLRDFAGIAATEPVASFVGELRPYQKEGLGWMGFLRDFSFGGCLADDMGLGKTVQVLALLEQRRSRGSSAPSGTGVPPVNLPSLVVAPRSLIHNWVAEAHRFTPGLRVLDHSHPDRAKSAQAFNAHDLVVTTYGTLRSDAELFAGCKFDYAILDEAQAIKNHATASAKAARLLKADHRLALSGTPVENHLGELWSLMEFLNPGMLGTASIFSNLTKSNGDTDSRALLARALRPFILRRTKQQVAADLPDKTEQTIYCELPARQRKLYDELRDHYRASLLQRVSRDGLAKSRMHVLEALLRLRQAACHPGLIDKARHDEESAKLDSLIPQIAEVVEEGHKALVFSQFTSFLSLVRPKLDQAGIAYEYLDGKTKDRRERVDRFQNDPACKLFLISLKAGGLGLNLTAAEYVFLLDPWWNPAVEAQAIDRAHRIGQTRRVFAYRLIATGTVEEKVLELQNSKRDLADAILSQDNAPLKNLTRDDLELLLS